MQCTDAPPRASTSLATSGPEPASGGRAGEDTLLERVATGDRAAFAALYDRVAGLVYGITLRVIRDPAIAEEVTQEVLLAVWTNAPAFDRSRGSARAWISTLAHRRAVDVVRSEQAARDRVRRVQPTQFERPFDEVAELAVARTPDVTLAHALDALTVLQRQAVELAYYEGLTQAQVAQVLEVPLGTAKTRIRDGLRRLTRELSPAVDAGAGAA